MASLLAFFVVAILLIVVPGQDTALTIRNTLTAGQGGGVRTAFGVATGQAVWALAAAAGLAALLRASEPAFLALRLAGAAYLVYLGGHALWTAIRGGGAAVNVTARRGASYRQGLLSNLGNPKSAVFFTSLLPQFGHSFGALLALGLVIAVMTAAWLTAYAVAVARAGDLLRRSRVRRALDAVTGTVLVAFGLRLASERS
jgi:threonine/homoserine/homoserine lactone efflux protein